MNNKIFFFFKFREKEVCVFDIIVKINLLSSSTGLYYDETNQNLCITNNDAFATVTKRPVIASGGRIVAGLLGSSESNSSQLNGPTGITLEQWQNLYVNDRENTRIQLFCNGSSTGIIIAGSGTGESSLSAPYDIKLDSQHNLCCRKWY